MRVFVVIGFLSWTLIAHASLEEYLKAYPPPEFTEAFHRVQKIYRDVPVNWKILERLAIVAHKPADFRQLFDWLEDRGEPNTNDTPYFWISFSSGFSRSFSNFAQAWAAFETEENIIFRMRLLQASAGIARSIEDQLKVIGVWRKTLETIRKVIEDAQGEGEPVDFQGHPVSHELKVLLDLFDKTFQAMAFNQDRARFSVREIVRTLVGMKLLEAKHADKWNAPKLLKRLGSDATFDLWLLPGLKESWEADLLFLLPTAADYRKYIEWKGKLNWASKWQVELTADRLFGVTLMHFISLNPSEENLRWAIERSKTGGVFLHNLSISDNWIQESPIACLARKLLQADWLSPENKVREFEKQFGKRLTVWDQQTLLEEMLTSHATLSEFFALADSLASAPKTAALRRALGSSFLKLLTTELKNLSGYEKFKATSYWELRFLTLGPRVTWTRGRGLDKKLTLSCAATLVSLARTLNPFRTAL